MCREFFGRSSSDVDVELVYTWLGGRGQRRDDQALILAGNARRLFGL